MGSLLPSPSFLSSRVQVSDRPDDLFQSIVNAYRDVLLSDWYPHAARQLLEDLDRQQELEDTLQSRANSALPRPRPPHPHPPASSSSSPVSPSSLSSSSSPSSSPSSSSSSSLANVRRALKRVNDFALACAEELAEMVVAAEQQQLEKIRRICEVAMDDMGKLPETVASMKPLLDKDFVAYINYAIDRERARISGGGGATTTAGGGGAFEDSFEGGGVGIDGGRLRSGADEGMAGTAGRGLGLDPDREPTPWLQVLGIVKAGCYAELGKALRADVTALSYVLRMPTPGTRRALLEKTIDTMPAWDVRAFHATASNVVARFARAAPPVARSSSSSSSSSDEDGEDSSDLASKIAQLGADLEDLLPPERLAEIAAPADAARNAQLGGGFGGGQQLGGGFGGIATPAIDRELRALEEAGAYGDYDEEDEEGTDEEPPSPSSSSIGDQLDIFLNDGPF